MSEGNSCPWCDLFASKKHWDVCPVGANNNPNLVAIYNKGVKAGLEMAAKVCDVYQQENGECPETADYCAEAIRALLEAK